MPGCPGAGSYQHSVMGDLVDAPGRGPEDESISGAALEDHLFIELADANRLGRRTREKDAVEAAIGDRAAVDNGQQLRALAWSDGIADAVPGDPGAQLGEFVGRVAAGEQIEDALEGGAAELGEGSSAAHDSKELFDADFRIGWSNAALAFNFACGWRLRDDGDHLLREHIERIAQKAGRFDQALVHGTSDGGAGDEVGAKLGKDDSFAGRAYVVAGAADALHAAGNRWRRLDLNDEIDRAHVDAEFER